MMVKDLVRLCPRRLLLFFIAFASVSSTKIAANALIAVLFKSPLYILRHILRQAFPALLKKDVSQDVVLITGAASGIGRLLALRFARLCRKVVLLDVNEDALNRVRTEASELDGRKAEVLQVNANLADREATYAAMAAAKQKAGDITILINNAGIVTGKTLLESTDQQVDLTMQVNTHAHFWTLKSVLPSMLAANKGHIVTVSSNAGLTGVPGLVDYCASKFGSLGINDSLRLELRKLGKTGVKTTAVCPFFIKTGMFDGVFDESNGHIPMLCPQLEPEYVADEIVRATLVNQEMLVLPAFSLLIRFFQGLLPVQTQDELFEILGFSECMSTVKAQPRR